MRMYVCWRDGGLKDVYERENNFFRKDGSLVSYFSKIIKEEVENGYIIVFVGDNQAIPKDIIRGK